MSVSIALLPVGGSRPRFRIFMQGENDRYPTADFLENLKQTNLKSYDRLMAQLWQTAENGPPTNDKKKSRLIEAKRQIFELKTKDANRITWFYDHGRMIICTHGLSKPKKKRFQQDIDNAAKSYDKYQESKKSGTLITIQ